MQTFGVLLCILGFCLTVECLPFYSKRELAPSLTLHRLNALKDSIDQLNDISKQIRCQEKAHLSKAIRSKRMISPSLRLSELIDPLVVQDPDMIRPNTIRTQQKIEQLPKIREQQEEIAEKIPTGDLIGQEAEEEEDPCVAFYNDVPYYF